VGERVGGGVDGTDQVGPGDAGLVGRSVGVAVFVDGVGEGVCAKDKGELGCVVALECRLGDGDGCASVGDVGLKLGAGDSGGTASESGTVVDGVGWVTSAASVGVPFGAGRPSAGPPLDAGGDTVPVVLSTGPKAVALPQLNVPFTYCCRVVDDWLSSTRIHNDTASKHSTTLARDVWLAKGLQPDACGTCRGGRNIVSAAEKFSFH